MRMSKAITRAPRMISEWCRSKPPIVFFRLSLHHFAPTKNAPPRHRCPAKRAQNPLVSAKIGTICTYAALPEGSGTVSAHLRRQHKPTVVQCKLEVGMGPLYGKQTVNRRAWSGRRSARLSAAEASDTPRHIEADQLRAPARRGLRRMHARIGANELWMEGIIR